MLTLRVFTLIACTFAVPLTNAAALPADASVDVARRQLPDPLAPASSGVGLASSITGLVGNAVGMANKTSPADGEDEEDDEDPVSA